MEIRCDLPAENKILNPEPFVSVTGLPQYITLDPVAATQPIEVKEEKDPSEKTIQDIVEQSKFADVKPEDLPLAIKRAFNKEDKGAPPQDIIVEANFVRGGERVPPGSFYLAEKNKVPKIEVGNGRRLTTEYVLNPRVEIDTIRVANQSDAIFGKYGSYFINVPPGQYAKAWSGNKPIILGEGMHVRHDALFRFEKNISDPVQSFDESKHFVKQSDIYIRHGNTHIIRVLPGKFAAIVLNGKPKLLHPRTAPYVFDTPLFEFDPARNFIDQSQNYIAHGNFHQLRIPPGRLAKVVINNIPELLTPRPDNKPYIFNTPIFRFDQQAGFVNATDYYIRHETLHLIRVPPGHLARVIVDGIPKILSPNEGNEPHQFKTNNFIFDPSKDFIKATDSYIRHENMHFVRVPPGQFAKVIVDNVPQLLPPTTDGKPYSFTTANFIFDPRRDYVDQNTPYIKHGIRHILRLPKGYIAKAWYGNKPALLEKSQDQKDIDVLDFENPQFKLEEIKYNGQVSQFIPADEKLIVHGSIKRVITPINELAIINKNGTLDIVRGRYDIDSPSESVVGFFDTSVQTLEFPSKRTKEKRTAESRDSKTTDRIIYDVYTTSDSVEVGLKLLVAFCVPDVDNAKKALTRFKNMDNIAEHIEGVVRSDMTKIIKQYTSQKFTAPNETHDKMATHYHHGQEEKSEVSTVSSQTSIYHAEAPMPFAPVISSPSAPPAPKTYMEQVESMLREHLQTWGIVLIRMTIEESKILDADLTKKMSEQALTTAKTNADLAIAEQKAMIAKAQAEQAKSVAIIEQSQINESKIKAAQALLEAADFEARARERKAEADAKSIVHIAEAEARAIGLKGAAQNAILKEQAKLYEDNPNLFELKMQEAKSQILGRIDNFTVTSQEFGNLFSIPSLTLFNQLSQMGGKGVPEKKEAVRVPKVIEESALTIK